MKVCYVSNYINHHVAPVCEELYKLLGDDFTFIETVHTPENADYKMGYAFYFADREQQYPWLKRAYLEDEKEECRNCILESDAVITANAAEEWFADRLSAGKLTFRAHERWYKKGFPFYRLPRARAGGWLHHGRFKSLYMLCASAYTAGDCKKAGCFINRCFKWGYFTENSDEASEKSNAVPVICWCGRMIAWKHPEDFVKACGKLRDKDISFRMKIVGEGPERERISELISELHLTDRCELCGARSPSETKSIMRQSDILCVTSDFQEGWGVVINEGMTAGCAVISSHAAGAAPFLIKNNENGLIYKSGDVEALCDCMESLITNEEMRSRIAAAAKAEMQSLWSAENAAKSFVELAEALLRGEGSPCKTGPCSIAPILKNNWYEKNE